MTTTKEEEAVKGTRGIEFKSKTMNMSSVNLQIKSVTQDESKNIIKDERMVTWILGLVFVTIINLSSILGALLVPFWTPKDETVKRNSKMSTQQSFACSKLHNALEGLAFGSLLASSIFHLVPHAFDLIGQGKLMLI